MLEGAGRKRGGRSYWTTWTGHANSSEKFSRSGFVARVIVPNFWFDV